MNSFFEYLKKYDLWLLASAFVLYCFSLAEIYALSVTSFNLNLFTRHLVYGLVGFVLYFIASLIPYKKMTDLARISYPLLIGMLVFLLIFSREIKGSARWIDFGVFTFQPSEFLKLVILLLVARMLWKLRGTINMPISVLRTLVVVAIPGLLVLVQPDLGSSLILFAVWFLLLVMSPLRRSYFLYLILAGVVLASFSWVFVLRDYQKFRIQVFINPDLDPRGKGYNVNQAIIAVGSGGVFGKGMGNGLQSKLDFLPERQTDFIFATTAEEVGFVGSVIIVILYGLILFRIRVVAHGSRDTLGFYIAYGAYFSVFVQLAINIGMNIGIMPVTGIPLPLFSYGGSALMTNLIMLGVVQSVALESKYGRFLV